jgi:hypothetical protein
MSLATALEHHSANQFLRTSTNLNLSNRNCFDLPVKMNTASPIARVFAIRSHDDEDVAFASWAQDSGSFYPRPLGLQTAAPPRRPTYRAAI